MKKNFASIVPAAIAVISIISLLALAVSWFHVQAELTAGYESARLESYSPYGTPESPEEIQNQVKQEFAEDGLFLRIASGNVEEPETAVIVVFMLLALISSVSLLFAGAPSEKKVPRK